LAEHGYAGTTTTEVCRCACVSQGALFKHFATKADLLSHAAEHLFAALRADFRGAFTAMAADTDRIAAAVRVLWWIFQQPRLQAAYELYLAARTDPELEASLRPVVARHAADLRQLARELFPRAAQTNPDFEALIDTAVSAMQGVAMGGPATRDQAREERLLVFLTKLARTALDAS
jgi:AcrR family transcriptional regulator